MFPCERCDRVHTSSWLSCGEWLETPVLNLQIAPCIEGQSVNLETLVSQVCGNVANDADAIHVAVKNMVIQEASRKSYSHDKRMSCLLCTCDPKGH